MYFVPSVQITDHLRNKTGSRFSKQYNESSAGKKVVISTELLTLKGFSAEGPNYWSAICLGDKTVT